MFKSFFQFGYTKSYAYFVLLSRAVIRQIPTGIRQSLLSFLCKCKITWEAPKNKKNIPVIESNKHTTTTAIWENHGASFSQWWRNKRK